MVVAVLWFGVLLCCLQTWMTGWMTAVIDGNINSSLYQKILKENAQPTFRALKLNLGYAVRQWSKTHTKATFGWHKKTQKKDFPMT